MGEPNRHRPATVVVSSGRTRGGPGDPVNVPVVLSSTYHAGGEAVYGRDGNSTWAALEDVIGTLEGGRCLVFASGLAAVAAVVETLPAGATVVVDSSAYNGTRRLLADLESRRRLSVRLVATADTAATEAACDGADLLWLESPTNPLMDVADLRRLSAAGHAHGALVAVDNTFATPILQRPLDLGADVVVHSVTKSLAGHSDVVMGAVVTRDPHFLALLGDRRSLHGAIPGPLETFLALQGIRTLAVRLERAQANAGELARRLQRHPAVERVRYPGLPGHPGHALAAAQMDGFGTLLSFEPRGGAAAADAVCAAVSLCVDATSLGSVETLLERRAKWQGEQGTPDSLIRLSVGIEDVEDLWRDLSRALEGAGTGGGADLDGSTGRRGPQSSRVAPPA